MITYKENINKHQKKNIQSKLKIKKMHCCRFLTARSKDLNS